MELDLLARLDGVDDTFHHLLGLGLNARRNLRVPEPYSFHLHLRFAEHEAFQSVLGRIVMLRASGKTEHFKVVLVLHRQ
ncbi:hypothetical protein D3C85_400680 [compost metagenome]